MAVGHSLPVPYRRGLLQTDSVGEAALGLLGQARLQLGTMKAI